MLSRIRLSASVTFRQQPSQRLLHTSLSLWAKSLRPFLLADIGEGITECEVLKWSVKPNTAIGIFDPLCEVQSDKASVEITSPFDGVIRELLVQEGEIAKVGQKLCIIEVEDSAELDASPSIGAPVDSVQSSSNSSETPSSEAKSSSQEDFSSETPAVSVTPPSEPPSKPRRHHPLDPSRPPEQRAAQHPPPRPTSSTPAASSSPSSTDNKLNLAPAAETLAAPSVRHFARKNSIEDLSILHPGSGKNGRIELNDVEAHLARLASGEKQTTSSSPSLSFAQVEENQELPLGRTRFAMFKAMTKSLEIPHFGYSTTLDLTEIDRLLPILNSNIPLTFNPPPPSKYAPMVSPNSVYCEAQPAKPELDSSRHFSRLTFLPILMKTLSRAMLEWPIFRTTHTASSNKDNANPKPTLTLRPHADISLALSTTSGLYTPTIQRVDKLTAYEIMGEIRRLQVLGRQMPSGLTTKEMPKTGGTITVSNVGAVGKGEWAAPLLVPGGGVAIVAIGRAKWVTRENDAGVPERRLEVGVSWGADHRIIEGAEMAAFVESWRAWVENPGRMLADGR